MAQDPRGFSRHFNSSVSGNQPFVLKHLVGEIVTSVLTEEQFISQVYKNWALCDGRSASGTEYESISGNSVVPDMRGYFPRGLDTEAATDPDGSSRTLGDTQVARTARPQSNFTTNTTGNHFHYISRESELEGGGKYRAQSYDGGNNIKTSTTGNHSHSVTSGGDSETRPTNVSVNFFIYLGN